MERRERRKKKQEIKEAKRARRAGGKEEATNGGRTECQRIKNEIVRSKSKQMRAFNFPDLHTSGNLPKCSISLSLFFSQLLALLSGFLL